MVSSPFSVSEKKGKRSFTENGHCWKYEKVQSYQLAITK